MRRIITTSLLLAVAVAWLATNPVPTKATNDQGLRLDHIDWVTIDGIVSFHLLFANHGPDDSDPQLGGLGALPFGAFLDRDGAHPVGTFELPSLPVGATHELQLEEVFDALPPTACEILPGQNNNRAGGELSTQQVGDCPVDDHWDGNVDVFWTPPPGGSGGGQVFAHFGTLQVCPGAGASYIHVVMDCQDPVGVTWNFSGLCPGWAASLVVDDGTGHPGAPAPNPIPGGTFFDGWICVSATNTVLIGDACHFTLDLSCGSQPTQITMWTTACDWTGPVPTEDKTWGEIKVDFR